MRGGALKQFGKAQLASIAATVVDFGTLVLGVEILHIWYVAATALGAALGAVTNFFINRHYSFQAADRKVGPQALRYALISSGSLLLNSGGVYLITEYGHLHYSLSKVSVALTVGFVYNFPMQRYFVFR